MTNFARTSISELISENFTEESGYLADNYPSVKEAVEQFESYGIFQAWLEIDPDAANSFRLDLIEQLREILE